MGKSGHLPDAVTVPKCPLVPAASWVLVGTPCRGVGTWGRAPGTTWAPLARKGSSRLCHKGDLATSSEAGWSYSHPTREATTPRLHLSLWISLFPSGSARKKQPGGSHPGGGRGQSQVSERHMPKEWPRWQLSSPTQPKTKGRRDVGGHLPAACLLRRFQLQPSCRDGVSRLPPWLNLTVTPQPVPGQWARGNPPLAGFTSAGGRWGCSACQKVWDWGGICPHSSSESPQHPPPQQASGQGIGRTAPFGARVGARGWSARVGRHMHPRMR